MKVDFLSSRKELLKLTAGPTTATQQRSASSPDFGTLLGDIDPKAPKPEVKTEGIKAPVTQEQQGIAFEKGPMARYSFEAPELIPPPLEPKNIPVPDAIEEVVGVKTPTVLSVKRLDTTLERLARLPKRERLEAIGELVEKASSQHGVDPELGMAVVAAESGFNPNALSSDGHFSKGLFQLLDTTASSIIERDKLKEPYTPYEPVQNVELGTRYLKYLHQVFGKETKLPNEIRSYPSANSAELEKLAVAAFNAGEGRVASAQNRAERAGADPTTYSGVSTYLPKSTQEYVERVINFKGRFNGYFEGSTE